MNIYIALAVAFGFVGLLIYLMLRYGPVDHSWIKLEKDQIKQLKATHKAYKTRHPPMKPSGTALYRRRMISHEGLAIYKNGILAKFCVGRKGKYRFVPFGEISDIFPVKVENPVSKRDSRWFGLSSWKALQIETTSGMVLLVHSRTHDFEKLVPMLKRAMAGRWETLYRPEEVLWTNILEGEAGIHRSLRKEPVVRRPARPDLFVDIEPKVLPSAVGKGKLLLEESDSDYKKRSETLIKAGAIVVALCAGFLAAGIYILLMGIPFFSNILGMVLIVAGAIFLIVGIVVLVSAKSRPRIKIYENGFEAPLLVGKRTMFISYGEIETIDERKNIIEGELWVFDTGRPNQRLFIRKDMEGFDRVFGHIRSKIARAEHIVELEPTEEEAVTSRKLEYGLYATGFTAGVVMSVVLAAYVYAGMHPFYFFFGLGLILPPTTMITTAMLTLQMRKMKKLVPRRLNVKIPAVIVGALLAYSILNLTVGAQFGSGVTVTVSENIEPKPTASALVPGLHENMNITAEGHVLVEENETLRLRNVTLTMNLSSDKEFGIWVEEGATLIIENSTLQSSSSLLGYTFEIMGTATISGCHISGLWGDPDEVNLEGGLEIYSDDVTIEDTVIADSRTNGVLSVNSAPLLVNVTVSNAKDDGIEMRKSKARVYNSTIEQCGWAMVISEYSFPTIKWNNISNNDHGIYVQVSDPVIEENNFTQNDNYAIWVCEYSIPSIDGNTFEGNEEDILQEERSLILEFCGIFTIGIAVVCLLILFWVYKEGMRREY